MEGMEGYARMDFDQGDVCYALKEHQPALNRHCQPRSPRELREEVLSSPRLQRVIEEVAEEREQTVREVQKEAKVLLEEIGHKMWLPAVRSLAMVLRRAFRKMMRGIYYNREGLEQLQKLMSEWPVVLLPSHRSYLDFILVTYVMFEHNMQLPRIAAGQDFMVMSVVSSFLRGSGAFFLRRTFGSDKLYKAIFTCYVQALLCSGEGPIEFFVEGTRSRTAKSLHPKLGLLSMVVEPYLDARLPDVMLVPISLSYQRTLEEELFAWELLGVPKPKESTRGLLKARSILSEDYGSIFIHIGSPISVHDVCQASGLSRVPHGLIPRHMPVVSSHERHVIDQLGHMLLDAQGKGMHMFPSVMVAAVLLQHPRGIPLANLLAEVKCVSEAMEDRGAIVQGRTKGEFGIEGIRQTVKYLSSCLEVSQEDSLEEGGGEEEEEEREGEVEVVRPKVPQGHSRWSKGGVPLCGLREALALKLDPGQLRLVMETGLSWLLLAHYRNQLLHLFTLEALAALSLNNLLPTPYGPALLQFQVLHCALSKEFVLPLATAEEVFHSSVQVLLDRSVIVCYRQGELSLNSERESHFLFLVNLLMPFVAGMWVVCKHLLLLGGGVETVPACVKGSQLLGARLLWTGHLQSYEVLSLEIIKNALASLTEAQLIFQVTSDSELGRDRLVKVSDERKLQQMTHQLENIVLQQDPLRAHL